MQIIKIAVVFIAGVLVGALATNFLLDKEQTELEDDGTQITDNEINTDVLGGIDGDTTTLLPDVEASLVVENQLAGESVMVKNVKMPQAGWVVVHEVLDGFVANALGATRIDAGEYDLVIIELLRPSIPQSKYVVTLYADDGNRQFEINADSPMIDSTGNAIFEEFQTASGSAS